MYNAKLKTDGDSRNKKRRELSISSFEEVLADTRNKVWPVVEKYLKNPVFPKAFSIPETYRSLDEFNWRIIKEYPQRKGKYGRAALILLTTGAMGAKEEDAYLTAAAMQLSEDWVLIHDDFEDDSLERRGGPALHKIYGSKLAVNAGDILHVIMWRVLLKNRERLGDEKTSRLMEEFNTLLMRVAAGQAVEIKWTEENKSNITDEDWFFIADGKTSTYTIALPMRLGAIIGNANDDQLELLAEFGRVLGRCFQLVDDILDVTSDFRGLKKQMGNDIYEGKRTLLLGHLQRTIKSADKRRLEEILSRPRNGKTGEEVEWVIRQMNELGSIKYAKSVAEKLADDARGCLMKLDFLCKEPYREKLGWGIDFILKRDH